MWIDTKRYDAEKKLYKPMHIIPTNTEKGEKMKQESFIATILEDNRITVPILTVKAKKLAKGKTYRFTVGNEVK